MENSIKINKKIINYILLIVGSLSIAIAINLFLVPNNLSTGGASGIAIIIFYLYKVPLGLTVLLLNIPLFITALKQFGMKFCAKAIAGTLLLSIFLELTGSVKEIIKIGEDAFLGSIFGGLVMGIGLSLVFKAEGSTGGTDLLAQIIYKLRPISSISQILLVIDSVIITSNAVIFGSVRAALYSVVAVFISKKTVDIIFEGVNYTKAVNIISKKGQDISSRIIKETDRGVTVNDCIGMYTNQKYSHIISVVTVPEVAKIKRIVKQIDRTAFIYISNTNEVLGLGFKDI